MAQPRRHARGSPKSFRRGHCREAKPERRRERSARGQDGLSSGSKFDLCHVRKDLGVSAVIKYLGKVGHVGGNARSVILIYPDRSIGLREAAILGKLTIQEVVIPIIAKPLFHFGKRGAYCDRAIQHDLADIGGGFCEISLLLPFLLLHLV